MKTILLILCLFFGNIAYGFSANKVWFEFRSNHAFRVYVSYTIPALKEIRESYIDFKTKKEAEKFYWDLVQGADFYPGDPQQKRFSKPPLQPRPW